MTYSGFCEWSRETAPVAAWRGKDASVLTRGCMEAGLLLRRLQQGESLSLPQSRPLPNIGTRCHELRVRDENKNWRIVYRINEDRILILDVFKKTTRKHQMPSSSVVGGVLASTTWQGEFSD
jgi:hypothetical protein